MLEDLRDYGLIWQRKVQCLLRLMFQLLIPTAQASSRRFSPTCLATTLTSSLPPLPTATKTGGAKDQGFIVLETNYRLYAYTGMRCHQRTVTRSTWVCLTPPVRQSTPDCGSESVCVHKMALPKPGGGCDHT
jgi:hypothetical protein